ncbi:MAG: hypothetical protein JNK29_11950, partial [Anaerolineales bacterium]|nr:hypothetical protein [Anaerolineales bacterium]
PVQEVLAQKQQALCEHRSQMTRLRPDPRWSTLGEVAGGQFLPLFFQPYECFYRWQWPANGHGNGHI